MTWALIIGLAVAVFAFAIFVLKVPRGAREAVAAALLLGIAGYVAQGSPSLPSSPGTAQARSSEQAAFLVAARNKITNSGIPPTNRYVVIGDGFARNGQTAAAASVLLGGVEESPKDADAWLALANVLVAHGEGNLTPAALYAFDKAIKADPKAPGPPFFLGLAYAQSGNYLEARDLWSELLERVPDDADWKPVLASELARLNAFVSASQGEAKLPSPAEDAVPDTGQDEGSGTTAK